MAGNPSLQRERCHREQWEPMWIQEDRHHLRQLLLSLGNHGLRRIGPNLRVKTSQFLNVGNEFKCFLKHDVGCPWVGQAKHIWRSDVLGGPPAFNFGDKEEVECRSFPCRSFVLCAVLCTCQACGGQMKHVTIPMEAAWTARLHMDCMCISLWLEDWKGGGAKHLSRWEQWEAFPFKLLSRESHPCAGPYRPTNNKMWAWSFPYSREGL